MRIVELCTNVMSGSVGRIVRDLCARFISDGHEVLICYGRGNTASGDIDTYKIDNNFDIFNHVIKARITDSDGKYSKSATEKLISRLKVFKPDCLHIHCLHGYYINYELLFKYIIDSNIKVIWTFHDCWAFTGHCTYFDLAKCNKWINGCEECLQKKEYPSSLFFDKSKQNWQLKKSLFTKVEEMTIVTPSMWLSDLVKQSFFSKYKTVIINNGVDTDIFKPTISKFKTIHNINNKKIILGVASIWDKRKGLLDFFELARKISDNYVIVLVGLSNDQLVNLPANVLGIGRTNSIQELVEIYTEAHVLFNPTYEDNYPTVNIEALACGTPVITYKTGGSPEVITSNNGLVVQPKSWNEIINFIENSCIERSVCRNSVLEKDRKHMADNYLRLFNEIIKV